MLGPRMVRKGGWRIGAVLMLCLGVITSESQADEMPAGEKPASMTQAYYPASTMGGYIITDVGGCCDSFECCDCCCPCECCCPPGRVWFEADFLYWWTRGMSLPPLATASPAGTPVTNAGVLSDPNTQILIGNERVNNGINPGVRLRGGFWLDRAQKWGLDFGGMWLDVDDDSFIAGSTDGSSIVSRPFFNVITGMEDSQLVSFPGVLSGTVSVLPSTEMYGADANLRRSLCCGGGCGEMGSGCDFPTRQEFTGYHCYKVDLLAGYRYFSLSDTLGIQEDLTVINQGLIPPGTNILVEDRFRTNNQFHGGQIGLATTINRGRFSFDFLGKLAMGVNNTRLRVNGGTTAIVPSLAPVASQGGLLAQNSNIGDFTQSRFAVLPEVGVSMGYWLTPHLKVKFGYNALYLNNVLRAGDQIDLALNPTQIPPGILVGPARPNVDLDESSFWAHGFTFGSEIRF